MGSYLRPRSLPEALAALASGPHTLLAGGTDHFPARVVQATDEHILDITALPDLRRIERRDDHLWIPCQATWTDVIEAYLPPLLDGLVAAARQVGGVQVQNAGTVVGNLANASPAADGIPCLLALDAVVELASIRGNRTLGVGDFVLGPRRTVRRDDEIVLGLRIPFDATTARSAFEKLGARRYLVISIVMAAAVARFAADGRIATVRIAVGSCSARAERLPAVEAVLTGAFPDPSLVQPPHISALAPIDDIRATAAYRRTAALELVRRAVAALRDPSAARAA